MAANTSRFSEQDKQRLLDQLQQMSDIEQFIEDVSAIVEAYPDSVNSDSTIDLNFLPDEALARMTAVVQRHQRH